MQKNPYKYTGPLDPVEDKLVCVPRSKDIDRVITGIMQGDYWAILGPRQIGKTTFLHQLRQELAVFHCIYINLEVSPDTDEAFYDSIIQLLIEQISTEALPADRDKWKHYGFDMNFYYFLRDFKLRENKKIILFFDEIEKAPAVASFLHLWRKIFHERKDQPELNKYSVIIAGSAELVSLTIGPTSPYNIAKKVYLTDFTDQEAERLIAVPFQALGIEYESAAKEKLIDQTSGHPQLLQQICYLLVERALAEKTSISLIDVENSIETILIDNDQLKILVEEAMQNKELYNLVQQILRGEKIRYAARHKFAIAGSGPIKRDNKYCAIRNKIYAELLTDVVGITSLETELSDESEYTSKIYLSKIPFNFTTLEEEKKFLGHLFNTDEVEIWIAKSNEPSEQIYLDGKEKLIFCYLAYKNYKAIKKGFSNLMDGHRNYEHHLSSIIEHNQQQIPEWDKFNQAFMKNGITLYNEYIRQLIFSLRKELKKYGVNDLIPLKSGRGRGYLLKGKVNFLSKEQNAS